MNRKFLIVISIFLVVISIISAVSIIWWMGRPEGTTNNKHDENVIDPNIIENRTFGINKRVNDDRPSSNQSSPAIATDQKGNIYVVWTDERNGNSDIFFARSYDGGQTFSPNIKLNDDSTTWSQNDPDIAVDNDGIIYVVWVDNRDFDPTNDSYLSRIYFSKSSDGGVSFSKNKRVFYEIEDMGQFEPTITTGGGNVYVAWDSIRKGGYSTIFFTKSEDKGDSFNTSQRVDDNKNDGDGHDPTISADTQGKIYIAWWDQRDDPSGDIYFSRSMDRGLTFEKNKRINDDDPENDHSAPSICCDNNGSVFLVWEDGRKGWSEWDIYFSRSSDFGETFDPNVQVNEDQRSWQCTPSLALDEKNVPYVVWWDTRNYQYDRDIYFSKSMDNGNTFNVSVRVNDDNEKNLQLLPDIAVDNKGATYIVWEDKRNGNYDIYFSKSI